MLGQHTAEFGQEFEPAAIERLYTQTAGQPWLVNALCEEACFRGPQERDRGHAITENDILAAQEVLLQRQVVHLNQLADRLQEESVQRVIEPMLSGAAHRSYATRDLEYVRNLGLVALAAYRQPDLRASGAAGTDLRDHGRPGAGTHVVHRR